jgi:hypothetical protein
MFKKYLKDPLSTIAINTTVFIMGCLFFGSIALFGIVSELIRNSNNAPINSKIQHIQQHADEQLKFDKMIQLLDSINFKSKKFKD